MATGSFSRLVGRWLLLSLTIKVGEVAAGCINSNLYRNCRGHVTVNKPAVIGISVASAFCVSFCITMTIVKRIRRGAAARQKKQAASTTPNPPTTSATVGAGDGAEKTGPTPFTIPTANQLDLPAYTPIDNAVVVTSQPTSNTDPEKGRTGVVTTVTYPPNTYSAPNAHTSASDNPYTIYSPPGGPLTSPPPPFQRQPSY